MTAFKNLLDLMMQQIARGLNINVQQYNDTCVSETNLNYLPNSNLAT